MENLDEIINLVAGNVSSSKRKEVFSIIKQESEASELYKKVKVTSALMSSARKMSDYRIEKSFRQVNRRLISQKNLRMNTQSILKYAAGIVLIAGLSAIMFHLGRQDSGNYPVIPGLTSVIADKGQISKVILPDSTVVWLNSGTSLQYDNLFAQNNRNLSLTGQAYFDVKKNNWLPLIVSSGNLKVRVTGTRFDVCAYPDENGISVILESGQVELSRIGDTSFRYNLNPGEMAMYHSRKNKIDIRKIQPAEYPSWKQGELVFSDTPMEEVIKQLKRKFDVRITVKDTAVYHSIFNATFKNESLNEILDYIQFSSPITYCIENKTTAGFQRVILMSK